MRYLFSVMLLLSVAIVSCKKSDDSGNNGSVGSTERTWKVGAVTHTVNNYSRSGETYSAYDKDGNSINFSFASYPPAAGSYRVIANSATLAAGEVQVYVASFGSNADTYVATGSNGASATVSFEDTKIKIAMPETWARKAIASNDSLKISAVLSPL